jgi:ElaB/YqjD/DUF883 family membrane-anchored ribosome-binding protein
MAKGLLSSLTLGDLLGRLHSSISSLIQNLDKVMEIDKAVGSSEISTLRDHITKRMSTGEEELDNKKLLVVLNLLAVNENAVEVMKQEAEEWLEFIDTIERKLGDKNALTADEKKEMAQIRDAISDIRGALRGSQE